MKREFKIDDEGNVTPSNNNGGDETRLQSALLKVRNNTGMSTLESNE
jgi:flagellar hook protein FlgE